MTTLSRELASLQRQLDNINVSIEVERASLPPKEEVDIFEHPTYIYYQKEMEAAERKYNDLMAYYETAIEALKKKLAANQDDEPPKIKTLLKNKARIEMLLEKKEKKNKEDAIAKNTMDAKKDEREAQERAMKQKAEQRKIALAAEQQRLADLEVFNAKKRQEEERIRAWQEEDAKRALEEQEKEAQNALDTPNDTNSVINSIVDVSGSHTEATQEVPKRVKVVVKRHVKPKTPPPPPRGVSSPEAMAMGQSETLSLIQRVKGCTDPKEFYDLSKSYWMNKSYKCSHEEEEAFEEASERINTFENSIISLKQKEFQSKIDSLKTFSEMDLFKELKENEWSEDTSRYFQMKRNSMIEEQPAFKAAQKAPETPQENDSTSLDDLTTIEQLQEKLKAVKAQYSLSQQQATLGSVNEQHPPVLLTTRRKIAPKIALRRF